MKRIFALLSKESSSVLHAALYLGIFSFVSQIIALFRDRLLAGYFGAGRMLDIYYAAFRVPDFIFVTVASLVAASVIVPTVVRLGKQSKETEKQFINSIFTVFSLVLIVVAIIAWFLMPQIYQHLFVGFSASDSVLTIKLARILLISPLVLGISNLLGSISQAHSRFIPYALSPVMYNLGIMFGVGLLSPLYGVTGVVYGVLVGALLHLLVQFPYIISDGLFPRPTWDINWQTVKSLVSTSVARTVGLALSQLSFLALLSMSTLVGVGSVAILTLSFNLQSVFVSVFGVSVSLAVFPFLSKAYVEGDMKIFTDRLVSAIREVVFWLVPASALLFVLRAYIVRVVLGSGMFSWSDTKLTAAVLALYAISIVFQSLVLIGTRAFYALDKTYIPVLANLASFLVVVGAGWWFVHHASAFNAVYVMLHISNVGGNPIVLLGAAYSLGALINCLVLLFVFEYVYKDILKRLFVIAVDACAVAILSASTTYVLLKMYGLLFELETFSSVLLSGLSAGLVGMCVGAFAYKLLRVPEFERVWTVFETKLGTMRQSLLGTYEDIA